MNHEDTKATSRLVELGWAVTAKPTGTNWRVECHRGNVRIIVAIPGRTLSASLMQARNQAEDLGEVLPTF